MPTLTASPAERARKVAHNPIKDTPRHRPLPPGREDRPTLGPALERYEKAVEAHRAAVQKLAEAEAGNEQAQAGEREAHAEALIAGKRTPKAKSYPELEEAQHNVEVLHEATAKAVDEVHAAYEADREEWRAECIAARAETERGITEALDKALDLLAKAEAQTLAVRRLHPQNRSGRNTGALYSHRPNPPFDGRAPALVIGQVRDWLDTPYEGEGHLGKASAGSS